MSANLAALAYRGGMVSTRRRPLAWLCIAAAVVAACGDDGADADDGESSGASSSATSSSATDPSTAGVDGSSSAGSDSSDAGVDASTSNASAGVTSDTTAEVATQTSVGSATTSDASWAGTSGTTASSVTCGDGEQTQDEACDDGNAADDDGCSAACAVEPGWSCAGVPSSCITTCGDGVRAGDEACDDGDLSPSDGCAYDCTVAFGWSCAGSPSVCTIDAVVEEIALGGLGGCIRTDLGDVACFGERAQGAVGDGGVDGFSGVPVFTLDDVTAIAAGEQLHCGIRSVGDVWCWGDNAELAMGSTVMSPDDDQTLPIAIADAPLATAIEAGDDHVCVIDLAGAVWCWGDNADLQLGRGGVETSDSPDPTAVALPGDLTAIDLGLGDGHSCAVLSDGTVACWGDDDNGQLGDATPGVDRSSALLVPGLADVVEVEAGEDTTCVRDEIGAVYCWGDNIQGQLGVGNTFDAAAPQGVTLPTAAQSIALGDRFVCALLVDGQLYCWGEGADFQLGNGDLAPTSLPSPVAQLPDADLVEVEAGARGACVRAATGERWCWGFSQDGQLGFAPSMQLEPAAVTFSSAPVAVVLDPPEPSGVLCGVQDDGTVECAGDGTLANQTPFGADGYFSPISHHLVVPTALPLLADVQTMRMGDGFACVSTSADVQCWGDNSQRQLGQGGPSTVDTYTPVPVLGLAAVDELAIGARHACVRTGGSVQCWGDNTDGQVGTAAFNGDQSIPVGVPLIADAVELALGERHSCARLDSGPVRCWGDDEHGQLGDDDDDPADPLGPVDVTGLPAAVEQIVAGQAHTCARASGDVYCWGAGAFGQLGVGDEQDADTAQLVPGLAEIEQLAAGYTHVCARDANGAMWCWGESGEGQLGDGGVTITAATEVLAPTQFLVGSGITAVVAGDAITCIEAAGSWGCVGRRATGQLGDGSTTVPVFPSELRFGP